ncbi:Uncharacterised protein [Bordetella pertussis]|nr:Uncharacterised protein [Bordetella pertussis]
MVRNGFETPPLSGPPGNTAAARTEEQAPTCPFLISS